jgi:hypothetical protein
MASTLNAAVGAAAALLIWTCIGLPIARRLIPACALALAPVIGWAVHSAIALPIFFVLPFSTPAVLGVAGLTLIASVGASRATAPPHPGASAEAVPPWAFALAALLAVAPAAAIAPKFAGEAVYLSEQIFDHVKVALIDDMMKFGLPPGNPFFADADHPRFAYYYLWYFAAAELALTVHISAWEADIAMTWFSAAASLAAAMGIATWLGGRAAALIAVTLSATASARIVLWWIFGANNVDAVFARAAGFAGWLFQAAWVPQHILSAACVLAAVVLIAELAARRSVLLVVTLALVTAAGFESSTFIGGIVFAMAALTAVLVLLALAGVKERPRFIAALAVAAIIAACIVAPLFWDQIASIASREAGAPISMQFYPVLGGYFSDGLRAVLDPLAFWLFLAIELSAVYIIGVIALVQMSFADGLDDHRRSAVSALAALVVASLTVSWLLASTLAENNDLGWRAVLPAVLALTAFAAAGIARWILAGAWLRVMAAGLTIVLSVPGGIDLIRHDIAGRVVPAAAQFAESPELWAAVRRQAASGERVANNPLFLADMTPWPVNISWALLANRRSCFAGGATASVYTSLPPARMQRINAQFIRLFAGEGSSEDVEELARRYDCRVIIVSATDGAWTRDLFATSPLYRLGEEKADRWRIYRAAR